MNYRHHFHAGNFADVMKHALLVQLVRLLQRKEKGFLYLDTHAGRGCYDLRAAAQGDSVPREAEWPHGIGRLWSGASSDPAVEDYVQLVREFDRQRGNGDDTTPRFYPGSPWLMRLLARPQDRLVLCELQADEHQSLETEFRFSPETTTPAMDGYTAVKAALPPAERRALVLIDPPFESAREFTDVAAAVDNGLARLSSGVFAIWYPLTERARIAAFFAHLVKPSMPPILALELTIADRYSEVKLRGCGLVVVNPPWQFESVARGVLRELNERLAQGPGSSSSVEWLVPEK
jgi:23S rRNA (adenine2030-N6)-methyltransferase